MASSLRKELVMLVLQFLEEENFIETVHRLEKESGLFFNMKYFEELVTNGEWDDIEKYLSGFTRLDENPYSRKIFFEIRKQKYLEALDKKDPHKALDILNNDLNVFKPNNEDLYKEMTQLLTLENFRENEQLSRYKDATLARALMLVELRKLIKVNPSFRGKLNFPSLNKSRLRTLINQSLNWQHQLCRNPSANPDIQTLFVDHSCGPQQQNPNSTPSTSGTIPKVGSFPPLSAHGPSSSTPAPAPTPPAASLGGLMVNSSPLTLPHRAISGVPSSLRASASTSMLKRPRTPPNNLALDSYAADSEHILKRITSVLGTSEEVQVNVLPLTYPRVSHGHTFLSSDLDLPKRVVTVLNQDSPVMSMDFHPHEQTLLLVGTNTGDIAMWEVASRERLVSRSFKVWNLGVCSMTLQESLANDYTASVNRVSWSPDGTLFGVAYSKNIVHLYTYRGGADLRNHVEIEAHLGNVNDIAFTYRNTHLCVITCGDDKKIKVWDAATGTKQYTFEGHEAAVYSVCPHSKENIQFIFSTSVDGKIKAWLYDNLGSRVDYDAPGRSCTTMAYTSDGSRLFSCGTSKEGESHIVEWDESEGAVKRTYLGLGKRCVGVVQFDTTKNRFLAVGDECLIKFWDMDNPNLLMTTDADGGIPASPCIRFNKEGKLLAVSTSDHGVKILGNGDGARLVRTFENRTLDTAGIALGNIIKGPGTGTYGASSSAAGTSSALANRSSPVAAMTTMNVDGPSIPDLRPRIWKLTEINEPSQIRSIRLPDNLLAVKIIRLIYTNAGTGLLALGNNAQHKLWKWQKNERNLTGKATTSMAPLLWQPTSGILMTNDIRETTTHEDFLPCFALSKNDSYVMSASGGKISLFNMMTFKTMTTFMPPPPAATYLAFHPEDNNITAIGMEDSSIHIYDVRRNEMKRKLKGHQTRITGLGFSKLHNILVSAGADTQLCVWSTDSWEKLTGEFLVLPAGRAASPLSQTRVQFHHDQTHMLVVHETQLGIYRTPKLECVKQWVVPESSLEITDAIFSCDCQSIFLSSKDGTVSIFTSVSLNPRCRITPSAYQPSNLSSRVHALVIAAHPSEPNQFALGLADGGVVVLEPSESEGKWGTPPPNENVAAGTIMKLGTGPA